MPTNNKSIQILRGNKSSLSNDLKRTILKSGQPFFDKNAKTLQIGNGTDNLDNAPYVTVKDGAINDAKVASNAAIKGSKLADASNDENNRTGITTAKIENSAITGLKIANESISDSKVAPDADINGTKFKDNSISGSKLHDADGSSGITTGKIENNAITTDKIADDAITGDKISETASVYIQQLRVIKPDESTNPYDGLVRAERGVTCGTWFVAGNDYIQSKYMPEYIYYHNVNNREGKLLFPERSLAADGEIIATLNNLPKFQSINGNLYITT